MTERTAQEAMDLLTIVERELVRIEHRIIERNAVDARFLTHQILIHVRAMLDIPITGTPRNMETFDQ